VVIYDGTLPGQHTVDGTLGELAERTKATRPKRPAILVVGRVAALRQHLRWFDVRPLSGRRVIVTRPKEDAADLSDRLSAAGAEAIEAPMTRILPPENWTMLDNVVERIDTFGWIVFTSVNSVDHFMQRLYRAGDVRLLKTARVCAVGPSTRDRLLRYGLKSDLVPDDFRANGVVAALAKATPLSGLRVLVPCADVGREQLVEALGDAGAEVTGVVAYRTLPPDPEPDPDPDVYRMLLDHQIDAITFTSAASIRNFAQTYGQEQAVDLLQQTVVAVCGPVTAEAAARLGIAVTVMPEEYTVGALVDALVQYYRAPAARV
jgi:uroporphyrinogen III methyltransferase/synthase